MGATPEAIINVVTLDSVKLSLESGDTLAVMVPFKLSAEQRERLRAEIDSLLPGVKVLVLEGGITVAAIKATA